MYQKITDILSDHLWSIWSRVVRVLRASSTHSLTVVSSRIWSKNRMIKFLNQTLLRGDPWRDQNLARMNNLRVQGASKEVHLGIDHDFLSETLTHTPRQRASTSRRSSVQKMVATMLGMKRRTKVILAIDSGRCRTRTSVWDKDHQDSKTEKERQANTNLARTKFWSNLRFNMKSKWQTNQCSQTWRTPRCSKC